MSQVSNQANYLKIIGLGLVVFLLFLSFLIIKPFIFALLLAWVLAYIFYPLYKWCEKKIPLRFCSQELAAVLTCLAALFLIILPLIFAAVFLVQELKNADNLLMGLPGSINLGLSYLPPFLSEQLSNFLHSQQLLTNLAGLILNVSRNIITILPGFFIDIIIIIIATYYFLTKAKKLHDFILEYVPLPKEKFNQALGRFSDLCRGMIYGQVVVGAVQGLLAGLAFYFLLVPHAFIWGFMTMLISVIPFFGAAMVWVPVVGYLFFAGELWRALILFVFGFLVISTIDNILKPKIVGHHASVHPLIVLYGIVGGVQAFGVAGLLLGPFILMIFDLVIGLYRESL